MKSKFDPGWGVMFHNESRWEYNGRKIRNLETAKMVAFEKYLQIKRLWYTKLRIVSAK